MCVCVYVCVCVRVCGRVCSHVRRYVHQRGIPTGTVVPVWNFFYHQVELLSYSRKFGAVRWQIDCTTTGLQKKIWTGIYRYVLYISGEGLLMVCCLHHHVAGMCLLCFFFFFFFFFCAEGRGGKAAR